MQKKSKKIYAKKTTNNNLKKHATNDAKKDVECSLQKYSK